MNPPYRFENYSPKKKINKWLWIAIGILLGTFLFKVCYGAEEITLEASWYSIQSLKKEGTYRYSKGVMANGEKFNDDDYTCATRLYPLGSLLRIVNTKNNKAVWVKVTDRISKLFGETRIDLSKRAFAEIANLKQGLIPVEITGNILAMSEYER
jgi:rare lipoprotein A (peptidoglycan hydrolase)